MRRVTRANRMIAKTNEMISKAKLLAAQGEHCLMVFGCRYEAAKIRAQLSSEEARFIKVISAWHIQTLKEHVIGTERKVLIDAHAKDKMILSGANYFDIVFYERRNQ